MKDAILALNEKNVVLLSCEKYDALSYACNFLLLGGAQLVVAKSHWKLLPRGLTEQNFHNFLSMILEKTIEKVVSHRWGMLKNKNVKNLETE